MNSALLRNGWLIEFEPLRIERRDLLIIDGRVVARDPRGPLDRDIRVIDCRGRFVLPGLVNAHSRLWASQTLGMPNAAQDGPTAPSRGRVELALEPETVVTAAFAGALDAIRCGTTTLIDLHSSPSCTDRALDLIHDAVLTVGLRSVLSYEVTERFGPEARERAIAENLDFILNHRTDKVTGMIGAGDIAGMSDETMAHIADVMRRTRQGLIVRVDEFLGEGEASRQATGRSPIERLDAHGLLTNRTAILHAVHSSPSDAALMQRRGAWLVHCPTASARSGAGFAGVESFGDLVALGTAGTSNDMFAEARMAHAAALTRGVSCDARDVIKLIVGSHQLASEMLGVELGSLRRDALADFVIMNYQPRTPVTEGNIADHVVFGMGPQHVESVMIDGSVVYQSGRFTEIDVGQLAPLMKRGAERLWSSVSTQTAAT